mgnify:CR=1 FL=1
MALDNNKTLSNLDHANFFWMGDLTIYEIANLQSFVKHGFKVIIWTYDKNLEKNINLKGVSFKDANLVLNESLLMKFKQGRQKSSLSSFSNLFRYELLKKYGGWWLMPERRKQLQNIGMRQYESLIPWNFDKQGKLVEQSDFVVLPVTDDRHSQCKGNNRPIDALQQGRIVLTNPGIPSYDDLIECLFIGNFYETYKVMIENPSLVLAKIRNGQSLIDQHYTPKAVGKKWEQVYEIVKRNDI